MLAPLIGFAAAVLTVSSFVPQVIRTWRTRQTKDLSLATLALLTLGTTTWALYGILVRDLPVILTNVAVTTSLILLVIAKLRFG